MLKKRVTGLLLLALAMLCLWRIADIMIDGQFDFRSAVYTREHDPASFYMAAALLGLAALASLAGALERLQVKRRNRR